MIKRHHPPHLLLSQIRQSQEKEDSNMASKRTEEMYDEVYKATKDYLKQQ